MPIPINIDPNQQSRLWKRGMSLEQAWWKFGSQQYRDRYNSARHAEMPKSVDEEAFSALNGVEKIRAATAFVSEAFRPFMDQSRVANEMRGKLVELLRAEKLICYGYHFPRLARDLPVRVPDDLFNVDFINWAKSEIDGNGSKYFAVKAFKTSWLKQLPVPDTASAATNKKVGSPGRPSMKTSIENALNHLGADEAIIAGESKKSIAAKVREYIESNNEDNNFAVEIPSEKTVLKYLAKPKSTAP